MKWLIVILMMNVYSDGSRDTYVYTNPKYDTLNACIEAVHRDALALEAHMRLEYGSQPIHTIYCMRENLIERNTREPGENLI